MKRLLTTLTILILFVNPLFGQGVAEYLEYIMAERADTSRRDMYSLHTGKLDIIPEKEFEASNPVFAGTGLNDLIVGGTYADVVGRTYTVTIDGSDPSYVDWYDGETYDQAAITGDWQELSYGVQIKLPSGAGYTPEDSWSWIMMPPPLIQMFDYNGVPIFYLDGGGDWFLGDNEGNMCLGILPLFGEVYVGNANTSINLNGVPTYIWGNVSLSLNYVYPGENATHTLLIENGTNPDSGLDGVVMLYARDVDDSSELFVKNEAGDETPLGPHDPVTGEWIFSSRNVKTGKTLRVNMEQLVNAVEEASGEEFVEESYEEPGE